MNLLLLGLFGYLGYKAVTSLATSTTPPTLASVVPPGLALTTDDTLVARGILRGTPIPLPDGTTYAFTISAADRLAQLRSALLVLARDRATAPTESLRHLFGLD